MYEFQPFCLVLNSLKMTVFLIIKNKKFHPVLNSPTDDGGEKGKNKMGVSITVPSDLVVSQIPG